MKTQGMSDFRLRPSVRMASQWGWWASLGIGRAMRRLVQSLLRHITMLTKVLRHGLVPAFVLAGLVAHASTARAELVALELQKIPTIDPQVFSWGVPIVVRDDHMVVGAYLTKVNGLDGVGSVYHYVRQGGTWVLVGEVTAPTPQESHHFGLSAAAEGATVIVGEPVLYGTADQGRVYVHEVQGDDLVLQQTITASVPVLGSRFGMSLALSGDWLAVSAPELDGGYVYLFERGNDGWEERQVLTAPSTTEVIGRSLALDGQRLLVSTATQQGHFVYAFEESNGTWSYVQTIQPSPPSLGDFFGRTALQGDTLIVGAPFDTGDTGAVYHFEHDGTAWQQVANITPTTGLGGGHIGSQTRLSGDIAVATAHQASIQASLSGAVYLYQRQAGVWGQPKLLTSSMPTTDQQFGFYVDLDGNTLMVNAPGAIYVYALVDDSLGTPCVDDADCPPTAMCIDHLCGEPSGAGGGGSTPSGTSTGGAAPSGSAASSGGAASAGGGGTAVTNDPEASDTNGGCGCRVDAAGETQSRDWAFFGVLLTALGLRRRAAPSRRSHVLRPVRARERSRWSS